MKRRLSGTNLYTAVKINMVYRMLISKTLKIMAKEILLITAQDKN